MNARERRAYEAYCNSTMYDLSDAYGRYSNAKRQAWDYCKKLCEEKNGYGLKIISRNTSQFTAGFEYIFDEAEWFMYITKTSDTEVKLANLYEDNFNEDPLDKPATEISVWDVYSPSQLL